MFEGYPIPGDERLTTLTVTPDPGVIEVNVHPAATWRELVEITTNLDAAARACGLATEKFLLDGRHSRHRRRQSPDPGRAHAGREPAAAQAVAADQPADVLAEPSGPVLPVLGSLHRPDQPGPAGRRGPPRIALRTRDRVRRTRPARRAGPALDRRPGAAPPADRHHRQHPPGRVLHRQAVQPGLRTRPARIARIARLRDAAASADVAGADPARAVLWWPGSGASPTARRWCDGAPNCTTGSCCRPSSKPTWPMSSPISTRTASPSTRVGSSRSCSSGSRDSARRQLGPVTPGTARRDRALARARRGGDRIGYRPLRRLLDRTGAGAGLRGGRRPARGHLQRRAGAAAPGARARPTWSPGCAFKAWAPPSALHPTIGIHSPLVFEVIDRLE